MKYIIFAKPNKYYFLFLSFFIFKIVDNIMNIYINKTNDIVETFHKNYLLSMSDFLSIIPIIIIKVRSKNISKNKLINESQENISKNPIDSNKNIEYIYLDINLENNKKRTKRIFKFSIIVSIFQFLGRYINIIVIIIFKNYEFVEKVEQNTIIFINIIFIYILTIIILDYPFYRHHCVSMGIDLIFLVLIVVYDSIGLVYDKQKKEKILYILTKIIRVFFYSFEDVFAKINLSSVSAYIYLFYRGIIVNSLALLFSIVFIFVKIQDDKGNYSCVFSRFGKIYDNKINILYYVILFFNEYLTNLNIFLIIDKFSPNHFVMTSIISNFSSLLVSIIRKGETIGDFFLKFAIYIILIITSCIYTEFIILNFCGLQKYTKVFLLKKANDDIRQASFNNINEHDVYSEGENTIQNELINVKDNSVNEI